MKKGPPFFALRGIPSSEAGAALIIVLSFVVLLTVVVLAMLSHSLLNRMISNASSNVTKTDIYGHGAIDQIIGDLRQEIVAGSTVAAVTPATGGGASIASPYQIPGTTNFIYRPSSPAASVPSLSGPYTTTVFNATFPNLIKESTRNVAFEPYDGTVPMRAAAINSNGNPSLNGRFVSTTRWNKALLLPKASATFSGGTGGTATTVSDSGTSPTPIPSFVAPDWILTAADGTNPTAWPSSPATTIANPKSTSYVVGRYAYAIYNEGGLLDANVAGGPWATTGSPPTSAIDGLIAAQLALYSKKGPSAFADLTQLPGIADLTTLEGSNRGQHIIDSLVGWRNAASAASTGSPKFPAYSFNSSNAGNYLTYLLGLSSNFMTTGYTGTFTSPGFADGFSGQVLTDQTFSSRQQLIDFFENTIAQKGLAPLATEQAYLQDAMMYLGTFSRTLNQPSYWPDPTRPTVLASGTITPTVGNSAYQLDNTANPPFKSIYVGSNSGTSGWARNDGTTAVLGEPLVKKRFALSRLAWLTCDGPIATDAGALNTSDANINAIVNYLEGPGVGMTANFLQEGGPTNIHKYFGLTWVAGPAGQGSPGGYWYYDHGNQLSSAPVVGTLNQVAAANREPDFFELLLAGINVGGIAKVFGTIGSSTFTDIQDSTVSVQILQLGANIIDEANPTQYPTHIVYPFGTTTVGTTTTTVYRSAYGAMDLPYLSSVSNVRYIVQPASSPTGTNTPIGASAATPAPAPAATNGLYPLTSGTGVFMYVPSIWNPYDINGPTPINTQGTTGSGTRIAPQNLRIVVSSVLTDLNSTLAAPSNIGGTGNQNTAWPGPSSAEWTSASGLGSNPVAIIPSDLWTTSVSNAPGGATTGTVTTGTTTTVTTAFSYCQGTYTSTWTSESSTELDFSNVSSLYREPTALMQAQIPSGSGLHMGSSNVITSLNSSIATAGTAAGSGVLETSSGMHFIGWLVSTFPLCWTEPSTAPAPATPADYIYSVNDLPESVTSANNAFFNSTQPAAGETVRLEYQVGTNWIPYIEYSGAGGSNGNGHLLQYNHDFVPLTEAKTAAAPSELIPMNGNSNSSNTGNLWNNNQNGSPGSSRPGFVQLWDVRTLTWGFPEDVVPPPLFLDGNAGSTGPVTDTTETVMPSVTTPNAATTHSMGINMVSWGVYEPNGAVILGTKQMNFFGNGSTSTPNTDYYMDTDGTVRRAMGAYVGPTSGTTGSILGGPWSWTANTTVGLPLATTVNYTSGSTNYGAGANQSQSRPIILHRPYRSVAELGYVFSNTPYKNIDFSTPESPYSALLDIFCINEDYRPDVVAAGRVDLNTKQAPVLQALLAGAYRDEENSLSPVPSGAAASLTSSEAVAISQALVKRTSVGGTNPSVSSLSTPQPLSNIGDLVGRWINGTTVGTASTPINGASSYDGFSADLSNNGGLYQGSSATISQTSPLPSGNYNIIKRFRESTMRALSDAGQAGTWNLLIDVVAQSGHYPPNASSLSNFLVEGERRYWVHVSIDRSTGQVIDENIEPVNE